MFDPGLGATLSTTFRMQILKKSGNAPQTLSEQSLEFLAGAWLEAEMIGWRLNPAIFLLFDVACRPKFSWECSNDP